MDNKSKIRAMLAAASNSLLARVLEDTLNKKELDVIFPWLGAEIRENPCIMNEFETYIRASYPQVGDRSLSSIRRSSQGFIEVWFKPAMAEYWATYRTGRNTAGGFFEDFRIRGGYTADQWREVDEDVYQRAETALANYVPASRRKAWR